MPANTANNHPPDTNKKGLGVTQALQFGGAGGDRTRVRKSSTWSSTYLVVSFDLTNLSRTNTLHTGDSFNFRAAHHDTMQPYLL